MATFPSKDLARTMRIYETIFQASPVRCADEPDGVLCSRLSRAIFTGIALSRPRADMIHPPKR